MEIKSVAVGSEVQKKIINLFGKKCNEIAPMKIFSIEVLPNENLDVLNIERDDDTYISPLFYSIVWKIPKDLSLIEITKDTVGHIPALKFAQLLCEHNKVVTMHITCIDMSCQTLDIVLEKIQALKIKNILVLQGDGITSSKCHDFKYASDIVKYVRKKYGNYFCIGVAGDPYRSDDQYYFIHLKQKISAGVDYIITQVIYERFLFVKFVKECRSYDIHIPIIPGLYICNTYNSLQRMVSLTGVKLPYEMSKRINAVSSNDQAVANILFNFNLLLLKDLYRLKYVENIHWFAVENQITLKHLYISGKL